MVRFPANELCQRVMLKLDSMEKLIETKESQRRSRRDFLINLAAVIAALVSGLAGSWAVVQIFSEWATMAPSEWWGLERTVLRLMVDFVQLHPIPLILSLYLLSIAVILTVVFWGTWTSRKYDKIYQRDQSRSAHIPGYTWPLRVTITETDEKDSPQ